MGISRNKKSPHKRAGGIRGKGALLRFDAEPVAALQAFESVQYGVVDQVTNGRVGGVQGTGRAGNVGK